MKVLSVVALAAVVAIGVAGTGYLAGAGTAAPARGPGLVTVRIGIHHSRFSVDRVRVRSGTVARIVVRNDDPIAHELVVGDAAVHRHHELGSESRHPPVPGEVQVAPGDAGITFFRFDRPGPVEFACHLPGHLAYGMRGTFVVERS